jgi:hypothetical protein
MRDSSYGALPPFGSVGTPCVCACEPLRACGMAGAPTRATRAPARRAPWWWRRAAAAARRRRGCRAGSAASSAPACAAASWPAGCTRASRWASSRRTPPDRRAALRCTVVLSSRSPGAGTPACQERARTPCAARFCLPRTSVPGCTARESCASSRVSGAPCAQGCHAGACGDCPHAGARTCPCGKVRRWPVAPSPHVARELRSACCHGAASALSPLPPAAPLQRQLDVHRPHFVPACPPASPIRPRTQNCRAGSSYRPAAPRAASCCAAGCTRAPTAATWASAARSAARPSRRHAGELRSGHEDMQVSRAARVAGPLEPPPVHDDCTTACVGSQRMRVPGNVVRRGAGFVRVYRCGKSAKEVLCFQDFTCERRCGGTRACGRHACKRRCCDGACPPCEEVCGRRLKCGNHKCPAPCHSGPCR